MKIKLVLCSLIFGGISLPVGAQSWTPRVDFKLEDGDYSQTLVWLSGWSYALTEVGRANTASGSRGHICVGKGATVESKLLLDALNAKFKGQRITSEQAAPVLYSTAKESYSCKRK